MESALGHQITGIVRASGGCINQGARLDTRAGGSFFLKWNETAPPEMFEAEADGLVALRRACTARVPEPLARGGGDGTPPWLLLEYVGAGAPAADYPERLGASLAELHQAELGQPFGWGRDNWIGSLPQANEERHDWGDFWRDLRIVPQLQLARSRGFLGGDTMDRLLVVIPDALADVEYVYKDGQRACYWRPPSQQSQVASATPVDAAPARGQDWFRGLGSAPRPR